MVEEGGAEEEEEEIENGVEMVEVVEEVRVEVEGAGCHSNLVEVLMEVGVVEGGLEGEVQGVEEARPEMAILLLEELMRMGVLERGITVARGEVLPCLDQSINLPT